VPPDEAHSPQKKDTRKWEQQAPQFRHGLASDMINDLRGSWGGKADKAAILGFASVLDRGDEKYFSTAGNTLKEFAFGQ
jgi:hypothetical protein